ncbi:hypothetical protein JW960_07705 [candidate division KSB1 bacterium]|nr:hypothetical protein [candidate division KSB1 bacterium]
MSVQNSIQIVDTGYLAVENLIEKRLCDNGTFAALCQAYEDAGENIDRIDLVKLISSFEPSLHIVHIRIVDSTTTIVHSNNKQSIGAQFSMLGEKVKGQIEQALQDSTIWRTRTRRNVEARRLSIYYFIPTKDHKYLCRLK